MAGLVVLQTFALQPSLHEHCEGLRPLLRLISIQQFNRERHKFTLYLILNSSNQTNMQGDFGVHHSCFDDLWTSFLDKDE